MITDVLFNVDALLSDDITYDRTAKRYRYKKSGQFLSRDRTIEIQKDFYAKQYDKFTHLGDKLKSNKITERELAIELKQLHISQLVISRGGVDRITNSDLGKVGSLLRSQYNGTDKRTGKKFGLKYLFQDVDRQSEKMLNHRLTLYAKASEVVKSIVAESVAKETGLTLYKRELGQTHKHCSSCLFYNSLGWQKIAYGTLPYPKTNCECGSNCVCSLIYDSPENVGLAVI